MIAYFQLSGIEQSGFVKKLNAKTILVETVAGEIIKRHIKKHRCTMPVQRGITFDSVPRRLSRWERFSKWWFEKWIAVWKKENTEIDATDTFGYDAKHGYIKTKDIKRVK